MILMQLFNSLYYNFRIKKTFNLLAYNLLAHVDDQPLNLH